MRMWLAGAVILPLVASLPAHAEPTSPRRDNGRNAHSTSGFLLPKIPQFTAESPLKDGMIAQEEVTPNAHLGLGLVSMSGRNIHSVKIEQEPVPTQNPGVTFIIRFPG